MEQTTVVELKLIQLKNVFNYRGMTEESVVKFLGSPSATKVNINASVFLLQKEVDLFLDEYFDEVDPF
jgi:hypothetical protein